MITVIITVALLLVFFAVATLVVTIFAVCDRHHWD
jgi:hypothetical protein